VAPATSIPTASIVAVGLALGGRLIEAGLPCPKAGWPC
jgi:hypothetical protein